MGVNQMTGTPWHLETLRTDEDDSRRHKTWCKHYDGNRCKKLLHKCIGSAHCDHYEVKPGILNDPAEQEIWIAHDAELARRAQEAQAKQPKEPDIDYCAMYPLGSAVIHNKKGQGVVAEHRDGKLVIDFPAEKGKLFGAEACYKSKSLKVIS